MDLSANPYLLQWGKYHFTADLLFDLVGFNRIRKGQLNSNYFPYEVSEYPSLKSLLSSRIESLMTFLETARTGKQDTTRRRISR